MLSTEIFGRVLSINNYIIWLLDMGHGLYSFPENYVHPHLQVCIFGDAGGWAGGVLRCYVSLFSDKIL